MSVQQFFNTRSTEQLLGMITCGAFEGDIVHKNIIYDILRYRTIYAGELLNPYQRAIYATLESEIRQFMQASHPYFRGNQYPLNRQQPSFVNQHQHVRPNIYLQPSFTPNIMGGYNVPMQRNLRGPFVNRVYNRATPYPQEFQQRNYQRACRTVHNNQLCGNLAQDTVIPVIETPGNNVEIPNTQQIINEIDAVLGDDTNLPILNFDVDSLLTEEDVEIITIDDSDVDDASISDNNETPNNDEIPNSLDILHQMELIESGNLTQVPVDFDYSFDSELMHDGAAQESYENCSEAKNSSQAENSTANSYFNYSDDDNDTLFGHNRTDSPTSFESQNVSVNNIAKVNDLESEIDITPPPYSPLTQLINNGHNTSDNDNFEVTPPPYSPLAQAGGSVNQPAIPTNNQNGSGFKNGGKVADDDREIVNLGSSVLLGEENRFYDTFHLNGRRLTFRISEVPEHENPFMWLRGGFQEVLERGLHGVGASDWVGIVFTNDKHPDRPVHMSFRRRSEVDANVVLNLIESVNQSNASFFLDDVLRIHMDIVRNVTGGNRDKSIRKLSYNEFRNKNKGIVKINNNDNYCLAYALALAIQFRINKDCLDYLMLKTDMVLLRERALRLCEEAGVNLDNGATYAHIVAFQNYLTDYKIVVYNRRDGRTCFYEGPKIEGRQILNLYFEANHYDFIENILMAFTTNYFCEPCKKPYDNSRRHSNCPFICICCRTAPPCVGDEKIKCDVCRRDFKNRACFENHKEKLCKILKRCGNCYVSYWVSKGQKGVHQCYYNYCRVCKRNQPSNHLCYIQKVQTSPKKWDDLNTKFLFVFYDFEATQDKEFGKPGVTVHEPNLCVAQQVCHFCINSEIDVCDFCGVREHIFSDKPVTEFINYVSSTQNRTKLNITCIAHNMKGYDGCFILKSLMDEFERWTPHVIRAGTKIMTISCGSIRFIDSLNFISLPLSKLPQTFGIESSKGYFPHFFNTAENRHYVGPLPAPEYYGVDTMKDEKERNTFLNWHALESRNIFNLQTELLKYCKLDVTILRKSCIKFRALFVETNNVDPFQESLTMASACNLVFRKNFLKEGMIGIIPAGGYRMKDKQSIVAIQWLSWMAHTNDIYIEHAGNGHEKKILPKLRVDGFHEETNTVYEFHGCYFHGCQKCFPIQGNSASDDRRKMLFLKQEETMSRDRKIREMGYNLIIKWECDFRREIEENGALKAFLDENTDLFSKDPLNPRDAFFGGRTDVVKLYHKCVNDEKIQYLDFTSLYPFCNKVGKLPVGHPQIYIGADACNNVGFDNMEGIVKCTVLPPKNLFHPVLPYRCHNKLTFPLCKTCADELHAGSCSHSDVERQITGTWITDELKYAVTRGYKIINFFELWQYNVEVYNPDTRSGGIFTEYVNMFLKMKQECSGWPAWVKTDADKDHYINQYFEKEGIKLEKNQIKEGPEMRYIAKNFLNSLWGKFAERENREQTSIVRDTGALFKLFHDPSIEVTHITPIHDKCLLVTWKYRDDGFEPINTVNVTVAAYTTATARLLLLQILEKLGKRVIYYDTDSVIFVSKPGDFVPPTGDFLGEFTDELEKDYGSGSYIKEFVSAGPKNYSYLVHSARDGAVKTTCKVKGITLNYSNARKINFYTMRDIVCHNAPDITIHNDRKIVRTADYQVISRPESKVYRMTGSKRWRLNRCYDTLPYGFVL